MRKEDLRCELTCAPCSTYSCITEEYEGMCEPCARFAEWDTLPEIVKRPTPSLSNERGATMEGGERPFTTVRMLDAFDKLDQLIENLYVGRIEFTVQNYIDIKTQMETIREGLKAGRPR